MFSEFIVHCARIRNLCTTCDHDDHTISLVLTNVLVILILRHADVKKKKDQLLINMSYKNTFVLQIVFLEYIHVKWNAIITGLYNIML